MDIVKIDKLTFRYNDKFIFDKFSLNIKEGSWTSITGSNGSGKSTLIKLISGLLKTDHYIEICNKRINKNTKELIGIVFDNLDDMFICETIEDDLAFILENMCYSRMDISKRIKEISKELKIEHLLNKNSYELSGGEKAKASLAIALIHNPKILLLDESLSMIDECDRKDILNILQEKNKHGLTIISVIHDLRECYLSDRLIVLNDGEIMLDGNPLKVMEKDKILNRLGVSIPFEVDLCIKLKLYGLCEKIIPDINELVNKLWV